MTHLEHQDRLWLALGRRLHQRSLALGRAAVGIHPEVLFAALALGYATNIFKKLRRE